MKKKRKSKSKSNSPIGLIATVVAIAAGGYFLWNKGLLGLGTSKSDTPITDELVDKSGTSGRLRVDVRDGGFDNDLYVPVRVIDVYDASGTLISTFDTLDLELLKLSEGVSIRRDGLSIVKQNTSPIILLISDGTEAIEVDPFSTTGQVSYI